MAKNSYRRTTCRLCTHKNLTRVLHLTPIPLPDEYVNTTQLNIRQPVYPLDLDLCTDCGNVQLEEVVDPNIIYRSYIYETVSSLGLTQHFQQYASDVLAQIHPPKGALVIDIGSNDGTLLAAFKKQHMHVLGIDPAVTIAKASTKNGIVTIPEFFTPKLAKRIVKKYGQAAIVTVNNLFANIDNLDEFTIGIRQLLADDGFLVIESFYLPDLIKNMVFDFIYHEHLSSFSVRPIQNFFWRFGMELFDAVHVPTKGGSMRYLVQMKNGNLKMSQTVKNYIALEKKIGLHTPALYAKFQKRITQAKKKLTKVLSKFKKNGKTVAGYGASATSTTLIYHFNLGGTLGYLIDDYARKQNTYNPGLHIPVISMVQAMQRKPDMIVILAWRYADPILAKNKDYLSSGGTFIIPLPQLKVVSGSSQPQIQKTDEG